MRKVTRTIRFKMTMCIIAINTDTSIHVIIAIIHKFCAGAHEELHQQLVNGADGQTPHPKDP